METFFKAPAYDPSGALTQAQAKPIDDLVKSGQYRDIGFDPYGEFYGQKSSLESIVNRIKGTKTFNSNIGPQMNMGGGNVPYTGQNNQSATGAPVVPPPSIGSPSYTVKAGDNLNAIAAANGITLAKLLELNPSYKSNPAYVQAGASLVLPPALGQNAPSPQDAKNLADYLASVSGAGTTNPNPVAGTRASSDIGNTPAKTLAETLAPAAPAPSAPGLVDTYTNLKTQYGVTTLEGQLSESKAALADLQNNIASDKYKAKGELVSSVVVGRKLVKIDADTADALNRLQSEQSALIDQIDNKTKTISTIMNLAQSDYETASKKYDDEYSRNIQMYQLTQTATNAAKDDARANLQIVQNMIKAGNVTFDKLPLEQRNSIQAMEVQAGYPSGFTQFVTGNVKGDVVTSSARTDPSGNKYIDIVTRGADGSFQTTHVLAGKDTAVGTDDTKRISSFTDRGLGLSAKVKDRTITYQAAYSLLQGEFPEFSSNAIAATLEGVAPPKLSDVTTGK